MSFLTDRQPECVETKKSTLKIDCAFDTVLNVQQVFQEDLTDLEKMDIALNLLVRNLWNLKLYTEVEKADLLTEIFRTCINTKKRPQIRKPTTPVLNFQEDGEYIYASFLQDYGIDLIDQQGRLPWRKFIALFDGLSDKTKIRKVMRIRGMELPAPNGKNQKQIQALMELKAYYALPLPPQEMAGNGLDMLFGSLEKMARQ